LQQQKNYSMINWLWFEWLLRGSYTTFRDVCYRRTSSHVFL